MVGKAFSVEPGLTKCRMARRLREVAIEETFSPARLSGGLK
jgi:hypothetical protein